MKEPTSGRYSYSVGRFGPGVLLERDREVGAALELEAEVEERAEAEAAERGEELR